jgi:hypothetical protein
MIGAFLIGLVCGIIVGVFIAAIAAVTGEKED